MVKLTRRLVIFGLAVAASIGGYHLIREAAAQEGPDWMKGLPQQHDSKWKVHDTDRPKPKKIQPGDEPGAPPSDAIVLFDGKDLSRWNHGEKGSWAVKDGYMEVNNTGSISTKESFGDCQLHLEYMAPTPPQKVSQHRGNSGIMFTASDENEAYEIQVLDNWNNPTYPDGYIGSVYGQHPPLVDACRKPGEWQTYDIIYRAPRCDGGKVVEPARVTVILNGVLVQHNAEIYGPVRWRARTEYKPRRDKSAHVPTGPISLQDHGDRQTVRFRNIWARKLDLSPEAIDNRT